MHSRFKLTPDGNVHIDNGTESYLDTLSNALADCAVAGVTVPRPDLQALSGVVKIAGFEVSPARMELILENGWHYPVPPDQLATYQPYLSCIDNISTLAAAQAARLSVGQEG